MSAQPSGHGDLGPEVRRLALLLLDRLDPTLRAAAALAAARAADGPGKCQQVWCPFCAVVALATGEEHPLLTLVAEHSVGLLTMLRALLDEPGPAAAGPAPGGPGPEPPDVPPTNGRYQHIPINFED